MGQALFILIPTLIFILLALIVLFFMLRIKAGRKQRSAFKSSPATNPVEGSPLQAAGAQGKASPAAPLQADHPDPDEHYGLQLVEAGGNVLRLTALPATIGRSPQATIVLPDPAISAIHARIYFDEKLNAVCIEDVQSLNGLLINDMPTLKNVLIDRSRITLGSTTLTFRDTGYIH